MRKNLSSALAIYQIQDSLDDMRTCLKKKKKTVLDMLNIFNDKI